jgi:hypothetical protein
LRDSEQRVNKQSERANKHDERELPHFDRQHIQLLRQIQAFHYQDPRQYRHQPNHQFEPILLHISMGKD